MRRGTSHRLYRLLAEGERVEMEGQPVTPGMKGRVISLHDGFHLDVTQGEAIPPKAIVRFDNVTLMVDVRMGWERVAG